MKGPKDHATFTVLSFDLCLRRFSVPEIFLLLLLLFRGFVYSVIDELHKLTIFKIWFIECLVNACHSDNMMVFNVCHFCLAFPVRFGNLARAVYCSEDEKVFHLLRLHVSIWFYLTWNLNRVRSVCLGDFLASDFYVADF